MGKKGKSKHKGTRSPQAVDGPSGADTSGVDAGQVATRLTSVATHLVRQLHREDAALGQSSARLAALGVLVLGGPRTLGQLAASEGVTAPSMTRLVNAMVADGLVTRSRSATDGRLVVVSATPAGAALLQHHRDRRVSMLAGLLGARSVADQRCVEAATGILEELARPARRP